jgi:hypothetical protein
VAQLSTDVVTTERLQVLIRKRDYRLFVPGLHQLGEEVCDCDPALAVEGLWGDGASEVGHSLEQGQEELRGWDFPEEFEQD